MTGRTALGAAVLLTVLGAASALVGQQVDVASVTAAAAGQAPPGAAAPRAGTGEDAAALARTLPVGEQAPVVHARGWLNAAARTGPDLRGQVVLYEFWTFGCVNCRNVLPHVRAWAGRYAADGLVVVGVHTPEFGYEADPAAVQRFVRENRIAYPVALDPDGTVWRDFGNRYWPQFYLHDRAGHRRVVKIGEGGYDTTEDAIRALLGVDAGSPRATLT